LGHFKQAGVNYSVLRVLAHQQQGIAILKDEGQILFPHRVYLRKPLRTYEGKEKEKGSHQRRFSIADQELEMMAVIGKIAAALSQSAGHTVEVYKAEENMPNFRVFVTTTEEGDHAVVMLRGSKVTVIPLFREVPEKLVWHIEILRKEIPAIEVEVITREAAESDV
jgi:hypothetical protein